MKKVKLTALQFDHRDGAGYARLQRGDVFEVDGATAARLVKAGAAILVDDAPLVEESSDETLDEELNQAAAHDNDAQEDADDAIEDDSESESDTDSDDDIDVTERPVKTAHVNKWRAYAKNLGIDTGGKSKSELIALVGDR